MGNDVIGNLVTGSEITHYQLLITHRASVIEI
jgi:hypothetical protein